MISKAESARRDERIREAQSQAKRFEELQAAGHKIQIYNGDLGYQDLEPGGVIQTFWSSRYRALDADGRVVRHESKLD